MKQTYIVLRSSRVSTRDFFLGPLARSEPIADNVILEIDRIERRDISAVTWHPDVVAVAPSIPMRLIEPVECKDVDAGDTAWGVQAVGADASPFTGKDICVAVLDTGIDATHPAFSGIQLVEKDYTGDGIGAGLVQAPRNREVRTASDSAMGRLKLLRVLTVGVFMFAQCALSSVQAQPAFVQCLVNVAKASSAVHRAVSSKPRIDLLPAFRAVSFGQPPDSSVLRLAALGVSRDADGGRALRSQDLTRILALQNRRFRMADPDRAEKAIPRNIAIDSGPSLPASAAPAVAVTAAANSKCNVARVLFEDEFRKVRNSIQRYARVAEEFPIAWHAGRIDKGDPRMLAVWKAATSYSSACLSDQSPKGISPLQLAALVGALGHGTSRTCTGVRVGHDLVLTARHCVMEHDESGPVRLLNDSQLRAMWFELGGGTPARHAVCGIVAADPGNVYSYDTDAAVIRIAPPKTSSPAVRLARQDLALGTYLYMPGLNLGEEQTVPFRPKATAVDGCRLAVRAGSCFLHGCQALPGMSGAPILVVDAGAAALVVAGVYIGGWEKKHLRKGCEVPAAYDAAGIPNVALSAQVIPAFPGRPQ